MVQILEEQIRVCRGLIVQIRDFSLHHVPLTFKATCKNGWMARDEEETRNNRRGKGQCEEEENKAE